MRDWKDDLLCNIFGCDIDDLPTLKGIQYDIAFVMGGCYDEDEDFSLNCVLKAVIDWGLNDLMESYTARARRLANKERSPEEEAEWQALCNINPRSDIEYYIDYMMTSVHGDESKEELYRKYMSEELEEFYNWTGFEILFG